MAHLLLVEPDQDTRVALAGELKLRGHRTTAITDVDGLAAALAVHRPNLVIVGMDRDPHEVLYMCEGLRTWSLIPLIVISALTDEATKVRLLDAGADDYMVKPIGADELLARLRAIERRLSPRPGSMTPIIAVGDLTIDLATRRVMIGRDTLHLTRKEYDLLRVLALAHGKLVTYEKLLTEIWGENKSLEDRTSVRTLVKQLRRKLREDLTHPAYLLTEAGIGYRLNLAD